MQLWSCLGKKANSEKLISYIYNTIQNERAPSSETYRRSWETDLGISITGNTWDKSLQSIHKISINSRHRLIQFKIIHRLYYSNVKLHKIFPDVSPSCVKCGFQEATLAHNILHCNKIMQFWSGVFATLSRIFHCTLNPDPEIVIFGVFDKVDNLLTPQKHLLSFCLITAKKIILKFWIKKESPPLNLWIQEMSDILHLERIRYILQDKLNKFKEIWLPFLNYLNSISTA